MVRKEDEDHGQGGLVWNGNEIEDEGEDGEDSKTA